MHKAIAKRMAREEEVRRLAGTMPAWQLAEKLGVTLNALTTFAYTYGISLAHQYRHESPGEADTIAALRAQGLTLREIAEKLGRSPGSVRLIMYRKNKAKKS